MKQTGAEIIINLLERQGITHIAGIPGGANLPLYDALANSSIEHILARHEQGVGFIAHGMARSTGRCAVCFATSGPGATNLITAIADAKLDSVPIIAITGQVPTNLIGTDAFQEIDTYSMTLPITKHNYLVKDALELFEIIPEAFELAVTGRPGPILIDVPKDIQKQEITFDAWPAAYITQKKEFKINDSQISRAIEMINNAEKPVLYIGGGIIASDAMEEIKLFSETAQVPVTSTLMGLGAFPADNPLYLGMLGMHGAPFIQHALNEADLIIACGVRFDDRATGKVNEFCPQAKIIHIDVDNSEINKIKQSSCAITGDCKQVLNKINPSINHTKRDAWIERIDLLKKQYPDYIYYKEDSLKSIDIIRDLYDIAPEDTIISTDVGQHQMWTAQVYPLKKPRSFLTSGGLGTMGFGLPAAIGAALEHPDKKIICISGDGSIQMNIQELATLAELQYDITIILFNNNHLGLVRQQQELFFKKNYIASKFNFNPNFAALAKEFGIMGYQYDHQKEVDPINMKELLHKALFYKGPTLLEIVISENENVFPIVPPGSGNHETLIK